MLKDYDPVLFERGYGSGFQRFQDLMSYRVHDILLVSSIYDSFILEEDGRLDEGLIHEYIGLNLVHLPRMTRASADRTAQANPGRRSVAPCLSFLASTFPSAR